MDLPFNIGLIRTKETEVGNFVADAMRFVSAADVAIVNAGSIRGSLSKGKVTRGELLNMCPFGNIVERTESDGATLRKALENSVAHYPQPVGSLAQVSGLEFTFDPALPPGKRVLEVKVGGKPLDDKRIYILTATDFMLAGGDGYTMLKSLPITGVFGTMDEVLAKYLSQKTPEKTELNRIKMTEATASRR